MTLDNANYLRATTTGRAAKRTFWGLLLACCTATAGLALTSVAKAQETTPAASAESAAPAAAEGKPLDRGDNAWMLTSSALVLMMTAPGLAMFYGGLVRKKNVLGV